MLLVAFVAAANAAELRDETVNAWDDYMHEVSARLEHRAHAEGKLLWLENSPERLKRARAGEVMAEPIREHSPFTVPSGLIHDWIGGTFIPNAQLDDVLTVVRDYDRYDQVYGPTVMDARRTAQADDSDRFTIVLHNKSLLSKAVLVGDYESKYVRLDATHCYSVTQAKRIREIQDYGQPGEHELQGDAVSGMIWRLYTEAHFAERDGGVFVEVEVVALSRDIPGSVRWMVNPIVRRVSRNSLITSLKQTQAAVHPTLITAAPSPHRVSEAEKSIGCAGLPCDRTRAIRSFQKR